MQWQFLTPLILAAATMHMPRVRCVPIDNGVVAYPKVTCGEHGINVLVNTEKPFMGRAFVKGEAHKQECGWPGVTDGYAAQSSQSGQSAGSGYPSGQSAGSGYPSGQSAGSGYPRPQSQVPPSYGRGPHVARARRQAHHGYPSTSVGDTIKLDLTFGQCNMRRQRTLYPRGVEYSFTLVVSFHPLFLTKVDRAYRIRCFYMEAEKTVETNLEVSMLTTKAIDEQYAMPQCYYHLKSDADGQYARFARVGDKITHLWQCDHDASYIYGMLVHSCFVDDGQGNKVQLVDEKGCSLDRHLLPEIVYDAKLLKASAHTHVFKYADKSNLYFWCTVQLCFKNDGGCYGITPPKCPSTHSSSAPLVGHAIGPVSPPHPQPAASYPPAPVPAGRDRYTPSPSVLPYGGQFSPPVPPARQYGRQEGARRHVPLQDDPVDPVNANEVAETDDEQNVKVKRSVTDAAPKNTIEADLIAEPLIVLPFDVDEDQDGQQILGKPHNAILLSRNGSRYPPQNVPGWCISTAAVIMLSALFAALLIFSTALAAVIARKALGGAYVWKGSSMVLGWAEK